MRSVSLILASAALWFACDDATVPPDSKPLGERPQDACDILIDQCGADADSYAECRADCAGAVTDGECWFHVCSAEVGLCDNEEPGDETITICAIRHGWYTPDDCDPEYDDCE